MDFFGMETTEEAEFDVYIVKAELGKYLNKFSQTSKGIKGRRRTIKLQGGNK